MHRQANLRKQNHESEDIGKYGPKHKAKLGDFIQPHDKELLNISDHWIFEVNVVIPKKGRMEKAP